MDYPQDRVMEVQTSSTDNDKDELPEVEMEILSEGQRDSATLSNHTSSEMGTFHEVNSTIKEGGNSSEEELEEIVTNKRKWLDRSDVSNTESDTELEELVEENIRKTPDTGSEEVGSDTNHHLAGGPGSPLQFCTSPPGGIHKPRRSTSPPDKKEGSDSLIGNSNFPLFVSTGAFRYDGPIVPCIVEPERNMVDERMIQVRKRSRSSRVQHIQRPCLDLEKMQQLRNQDSGWRSGGELSLFCW